MKKLILGVLLGLTAFEVRPDQLVITGSAKTGTFQKFENGKFEFMTDKGKFIKQDAVQVTKLGFDQPVKVNYQCSDTGQMEEGELQGFEKKVFNFFRGGQTISVPLAKIRSVSRKLDFEGDGNGGNDSNPIPVINLDELVKGEITLPQQVALDRYSKARKALDAFISESTALTKEMDQAKNASRMALLNKLRERKVAEQPLRNELGTAYKSLVELFNLRPPSKK